MIFINKAHVWIDVRTVTTSVSKSMTYDFHLWWSSIVPRAATRSPQYKHVLNWLTVDPLYHFLHIIPFCFLVCLLTCCWFRLYWKIKYVSRLQYLWDDIKKGEIEIPDFVKSHDDILENRPLTDYGIEPDPFHLTGIPSTTYSFGKYEERWAGRNYVS